MRLLKRSKSPSTSTRQYGPTLSRDAFWFVGHRGSLTRSNESYTRSRCVADVFRFRAATRLWSMGRPHAAFRALFSTDRELHLKRGDGEPPRSRQLSRRSAEFGSLQKTSMAVGSSTADRRRGVRAYPRNWPKLIRFVHDAANSSRQQRHRARHSRAGRRSPQPLRPRSPTRHRGLRPRCTHSLRPRSSTTSTQPYICTPRSSLQIVASCCCRSLPPSATQLWRRPPARRL